MRYLNRDHAGQQLAMELRYLRSEDPVVLGVPRGGVPVAFVIAQALGAPLDVIVVRKLGVPYQPELAMGAVGEGGVRVVNDDIRRLAGVSPAELALVERNERAEVDVRARRFRGKRARVPLDGRTVIVVDDGVATGSTVRAACQVARANGVGHLVVAVPVASPDALEQLRLEADEVVCLSAPPGFHSVGQWYRDFGQTSDEEVARLLERANASASPGGAGPAGAGWFGRSSAHGVDREVGVDTAGVSLPGRLAVPKKAHGLVLFAHGSGSSRHSPRNRYVAQALHRSGLGTLLFDLLTPAEEMQRDTVFDVDLLADRLLAVTRAMRHEPGVEHLRVGYFGASTGAAAALAAAAVPGSAVGAVVSRGGRPDLAGSRLPRVHAPTLLIVGGRDDVVLELNRRALRQLRCPARLEVVPGATHLFEEPGALDTVADLARAWFLEHLGAAQTSHAL